MTRTICMLTIAVALLAPAAAHAEVWSGPTTTQSMAIADQWAAQTVPDLPNYCANGNLRITWEHDPRSGDGGMADGLAYGWDATGAWDHTACWIAIRIGLTPRERCAAIVHELLHIVIGPQHEGPLDPRHPIAPACYAPGSLRTQLLDSIRQSLPVAHQRAWRIGCGPGPIVVPTRRTRRITCRATRPSARYARVFTAEILNYGHDFAHDTIPRLVR